ncbi:MAG: hypothetical protein RSD83_18735, partial [Hafnia sp.]|uniref:hypothetical protein n=1 Tax=Hafnia sp. TaxID=1873498 RepID=UPI002FC6972C
QIAFWLDQADTTHDITLFYVLGEDCTAADWANIQELTLVVNKAPISGRRLYAFARTKERDIYSLYP